MKNQHRRILRSRYVVIILSAVLGTLSAIGACFFVLAYEYRVAEIDFQSRAKSFVEIVNANLADASTLLYTVAAFIRSHDHPASATEFKRFSASLHRRFVGLRDTGWAPRVTFAERAEFEREQTRTMGDGRYLIRQRGPHGRLVSAPARPMYYPLLYVEADAAKKAVLGIDLIAESRRSDVILRAVATGQPAATPPLDVTTIERSAGGVLGYMAVQDADRRRGAGLRFTRGVVLGVFDIAPMIEDIVAKAHAAELHLLMFDPAAPQRVIYRSPSATGAPEPTRPALLAGVHWQGTVLMIDRRWVAIVTPQVPLSVFHLSGNAALVFLAGLAATATAPAYLLISLRRTLELEALTESLRATTIELHRNSEHIAYLSRHDELTGLPNRTLFSERIDEAVERSRRGIPFALLFLDLDRFKSVNDTLGHSAGDLLLCAVAERVKHCLRSVDMAARRGGDEFAIIVADTASVAEITIVTGRLLARIREAFPIEGRSVVVRASIGVAISSADATAESLLKHADLALYEAKAAGRGTCRFFDEQMLTRADRREFDRSEPDGRLRT